MAPGAARNKYIRPGFWEVVMPHLTTDELIDYTNGERKKWHQWLAANPDAMSVPAQRQGRFLSVGSLIDHIFLVERRHLQRLKGQSPIADGTGVADTDVAGLFAFGDKAREDLVEYARSLGEDAARTVHQFDVRGQRVAMTPRKLLFHIFIHEIRHWAQVALALRNGGHEPPGNHDLFNSDALE
jgi:uncharacterized damage-inducible protein DinB